MDNQAELQRALPSQTKEKKMVQNFPHGLQWKQDAYIRNSKIAHN